MIFREVDSNNDWNFGAGKQSYATDAKAIELNIKTRILSWLEDCFFALQEGVDWKNRLDSGQQDALTNEIRTLLLQSNGVTSINSIRADFNSQNRSFLIQYDIQTIYSPSFQRALEQAAGSVI